MTYQILSAIQLQDTINVDVQLTDNSGNVSNIVVANFRPQSLQEINNNIVSRITSIQQQQEAIDSCTSLIGTITCPGTITTI